MSSLPSLPSLESILRFTPFLAAALLTVGSQPWLRPLRLPGEGCWRKHIAMLKEPSQCPSTHSPCGPHPPHHVLTVPLLCPRPDCLSLEAHPVSFSSETLPLQLPFVHRESSPRWGHFHQQLHVFWNLPASLSSLSSHSLLLTSLPLLRATLP